jgi:hypothetical protein
VNDYARGALEALVWVESLLGRVDPDQLKREVVGARGDLLEQPNCEENDSRARARCSVLASKHCCGCGQFTSRICQPLPRG